MKPHRDASGCARALPAARPLRLSGSAEVRRRLQAATARGDGMAGAHCIHELWMRAELGMDFDSALDRLWQRAAPSIPEWLPMTYVEWLATAYEVAARFRASRRGRSNI